MGWEDSAAIWIGVLTAVVTVLGSLYTIYREWQQWRQNQARRLDDAATVAVRRTEASFVRPRLTDRLGHALTTFVATHPTDDPVRFRTLLFAELNRRVRLTEDEKTEARETGVRNLVSAMRTAPSPPLKVFTAEQVQEHRGRLLELVENAYGLRPRASADLIRQLANFCAAGDHHHQAVLHAAPTVGVPEESWMVDSDDEQVVRRVVLVGKKKNHRPATRAPPTSPTTELSPLPSPSCVPTKSGGPTGN